MPEDHLIELAVTALEKISEAHLELFQARKVGMEVVIPPAVEAAYIVKHGAGGQNMINMLRGKVRI